MKRFAFFLVILINTQILADAQVQAPPSKEDLEKKAMILKLVQTKYCNPDMLAVFLKDLGEAQKDNLPVRSSDDLIKTFWNLKNRELVYFTLGQNLKSEEFSLPEANKLEKNIKELNPELAFTEPKPLDVKKIEEQVKKLNDDIDLLPKYFDDEDARLRELGKKVGTKDRNALEEMAEAILAPRRAEDEVAVKFEKFKNPPSDKSDRDGMQTYWFLRMTLLTDQRDHRNNLPWPKYLDPVTNITEEIDKARQEFASLNEEISYPSRSQNDLEKLALEILRKPRSDKEVFQKLQPYKNAFFAKDSDNEAKRIYWFLKMYLLTRVKKTRKGPPDGPHWPEFFGPVGVIDIEKDDASRCFDIYNDRKFPDFAKYRADRNQLLDQQNIRMKLQLDLDSKSIGPSSDEQRADDMKSCMAALTQTIGDGTQPKKGKEAPSSKPSQAPAPVAPAPATAP